jgi:DNA-binding NarL/FixJ family response regulator
VIQVAVSASSPVVRAGLEAMLADAPGIHLRLTADGEAPPPDVLILDVPNGTGAEEAMLEVPPGPLVLLLADEAEATGLGGLFRAGARGVVGRDITSDALIAAVLAAAAGLLVLPESAAHALGELPAGAGLRSDLAVEQSLSPRETEVLRLLADGLGNKGIGRRLGISEHTVKAHVSAILAKLGAASRAEAVAAGARLGVLLL